MADEKTHTATCRMFDQGGSLAAIPGDKVPDSVWKGLTAEKEYPSDEFHQVSETQQAADVSKKRAPARESR